MRPKNKFDEIVIMYFLGFDGCSFLTDGSGKTTDDV